MLAFGVYAKGEWSIRQPVWADTLPLDLPGILIRSF